MARENIQVRTGNRIYATLDGQQIGLIQNVRGADDYGPEPASGIGDIHVQEWAPTMARHTLQVSQMVMFRDTMRGLGVSLENGDDALRGMVFDIEWYDKDSGELLRKYIDCSMASGEVDVRKHAILVNNATFNARDATGRGV